MPSSSSFFASFQPSSSLPSPCFHHHCSHLHSSIASPSFCVHGCWPSVSSRGASSSISLHSYGGPPSFCACLSSHSPSSCSFLPFLHAWPSTHLACASSCALAPHFCAGFHFLHASSFSQLLLSCFFPHSSCPC